MSCKTLALCLAVVLLSVPAATLTGPAAKARAAHHASPRTLVLRASDLPSGFKLTTRHSDPAAPPAGMPGAPSIVSAYETAFSGPARPGLWTVDNVVSEFRSAKAARSDLARVIPYQRQTNAGHRCRSFAASGVGAARSEYLCDLAGEGGRLTSGAIWFRRGVYVAMIAVTGSYHGFSSKQVAHLARIVDGRLRKAG